MRALINHYCELETTVLTVKKNETSQSILMYMWVPPRPISGYRAIFLPMNVIGI